MKKGKRVLLQGPSNCARYIIVLAESLIMRDKYTHYYVVDYEGEKDLFKIELKWSKK